MNTLIYDVAYAIYFILPAYFANAFPVILGGGRPIDGGRTLSDGKPLFGPHKTVRGFVAGLATGTLISLVLCAAFQYELLLGFMLSLGALTGDLLHSFFKRRMGIPAGSPLPVADQLDFVLVALLFSLFVPHSQPPLYLLPTPPPSILTIAIIVVVITLPIHLLTNFLAYLLGVKKAPW